jgi:hypothetical protein
MGCFDMSFPHLISVTKLCTSGRGKIRPWVYLALTVQFTRVRREKVFLIIVKAMHSLLSYSYKEFTNDLSKKGYVIFDGAFYRTFAVID